MYLSGSGSLSLSLAPAHTPTRTRTDKKDVHTRTPLYNYVFTCVCTYGMCIYIYVCMLTEKERERARDARWSLGFTAENTTSSVRIVAFSSQLLQPRVPEQLGLVHANTTSRKDYHQIARAGFFELILFTRKFEANLSRIQANPLRPCTDPARIWAIAFDLTEVQPFARKLQLLVRSRETGLSGRSPCVHSIAGSRHHTINRKSCDLKSLGFGSQYALLPPLNDQRKRGFVLLQFWNLSQQPVPSNPGPR